MPESMFSEDEARYFDERIPGWREMTNDELLDAIRDGRARGTARMDQIDAERREPTRFLDALERAMDELGTVYVVDVADEVARGLYGGHTPLTRKELAAIAAIAAADGG